MWKGKEHRDLSTLLTNTMVLDSCHTFIKPLKGHLIIKNTENLECSKPQTMQTKKLAKLSRYRTTLIITCTS